MNMLLQWINGFIATAQRSIILLKWKSDFLLHPTASGLEVALKIQKWDKLKKISELGH